MVQHLSILPRLPDWGFVIEILGVRTCLHTYIHDEEQIYYLTYDSVTKSIALDTNGRIELTNKSCRTKK